MVGVLAAVGLSAAMLGQAGEAVRETPDLLKARSLVKQLGGSLKKELKAALKAKGPAGAIEVCHLKAPDITKAVGDRSGWTVRRTSLKVRNLEDAPDKWELKVLEQFERRKAAGEPLSHMEYTEVVMQGGKRLFRYMKAIPTGKVCLKCHGSNLKTRVSMQLDSLYPFDQATGFKVGDIRGAFSLSRELHN
jgi:hypothetical protein